MLEPLLPTGGSGPVFRGGTSPPSTGPGTGSTTSSADGSAIGAWHRILTRPQSLADADGAITWNLNVAPTVCRAHWHAAGEHNIVREDDFACVFCGSDLPAAWNVDPAP